MYGHLVLAIAIVEGDIGVMKEVVGKTLLDILLLVANADDKLGMAIVGIPLYDMLEYLHAADLHH